MWYHQELYQWQKFISNLQNKITLIWNKPFSFWKNNVKLYTFKYLSLVFILLRPILKNKMHYLKPFLWWWNITVPAFNGNILIILSKEAIKTKHTAQSILPLYEVILLSRFALQPHTNPSPWHFSPCKGKHKTVMKTKWRMNFILWVWYSSIRL